MMTTSMLTLFVCALLCTFQLGSAADMTKYYKRTGTKYLQTKSTEAGVISLKSGMLVEILKESMKSDSKSPGEGGERNEVSTL